jgi:hypothetical protein
MEIANTGLSWKLDKAFQTNFIVMSHPLIRQSNVILNPFPQIGLF